MRFKGQSLAEYGIIITLVAIVGLGGLMLLGQGIHGEFMALMGGPSTGGSSATSSGNTTASGSGTQTGSGAPADTANGSVAPALSQDGMPPGASSGSNLAIPAATQTAGAMGDSKQLFGNMDIMEKLALSLETTNPTATNAIMKLAEEGRKLAQMVRDNTSAMILGDEIDTFTAIWEKEVYNSGVYNSLSPSDQELVRALTNQSAKLIADFSNAQLYNEGVTVADMSQIPGFGSLVGSIPSSSGTVTTVSQSTNVPASSSSTGTGTGADGTNGVSTSSSGTISGSGGVGYSGAGLDPYVPADSYPPPADTAAQVQGNSDKTANCADGSC